MRRRREQLFVKGTACVPGEWILLCLNSLRTEAKSSFQKQEPICGRTRDSWPSPGSSSCSWTQGTTSKEGQTLLGDSSLLTPELTLQIKSVKSNSIKLEYLCLQRPKRHSYLPRVCTGFQASSECISLAAYVLSCEPRRLLHPVMLFINKTSNCHPVSTF